MLPLNLDVEEPYVPFMSGRFNSARIHEIRRRETGVGRPRRAIGRALVRAALAVAGLNAGAAR